MRKSQVDIIFRGDWRLRMGLELCFIGFILFTILLLRGYVAVATSVLLTEGGTGLILIGLGAK